MKCQSCGDNEATVHVTEVTDEGKIERHLCAECAQQHQVASVQKSVSVAGFLKQLLQQKIAQEMPGGGAVSCSVCGMSYLEFRSSLRLGCPNDYEVFKDGLMPILGRIQDGTRHCGKVPTTADLDVRRQNELIRMRRELERAVQREDYEAAAALRDQIKQLSPEATDG